MSNHKQPDRDDGPQTDGDLTDMLGELRVLLPGAQTLTAFLIILPFNSAFAKIQESEQLVYVITFICSILSLVLFTAPAAQHRLERPLRNRERFKTVATRFMIAGLVPLSIALVLVTQLVLSEVMTAPWMSWSIAGALAVIIVMLWWITPLWHKGQHGA